MSVEDELYGRRDMREFSKNKKSEARGSHEGPWESLEISEGMGFFQEGRM